MQQIPPPPQPPVAQRYPLASELANLAKPEFVLSLLEQGRKDWQATIQPLLDSSLTPAIATLLALRGLSPPPPRRVARPIEGEGEPTPTSAPRSTTIRTPRPRPPPPAKRDRRDKGDSLLNDKEIQELIDTFAANDMKADAKLESKPESKKRARPSRESKRLEGLHYDPEALEIFSESIQASPKPRSLKRNSLEEEETRQERPTREPRTTTPREPRPTTAPKTREPKKAPTKTSTNRPKRREKEPDMVTVASVSHFTLLPNPQASDEGETSGAFLLGNEAKVNFVADDFADDDMEVVFPISPITAP
eukprot:Blabericola_migrator_1__10794@NODE_61_length_15760_cov_113_549035_g55_i0_p5_GENE_NODE_61_length_15760_cov_113_549035_g55_i0NODE_61_length_15760_cov_113_549035_g55_i0_p5_ORF_typecomplete_len306_score49_02Peptidase_S21/PF00716_17/0_11GAGA_bind/PF06217_12/1_8_NODE_61_length_15760_cov_113_549035_g55_i070657982